MIVTLETYEMEMAAQVGAKRRAASITKGSKGVEKGDWESDVEAAMAEMAAAKALNVYWSGSYNTYRSRGDVGDLEIRSTKVMDGSLILRPKDSGAATYVLVRGAAPTYDVVGFVKGEAAMDKKFMRNPGGKGVAFFIPADMLTPIEKFPR